MLRILPHTVPRVSRSYEHFPDGFELHLLRYVVENTVASLFFMVDGWGIRGEVLGVKVEILESTQLTILTSKARKLNTKP